MKIPLTEEQRQHIFDFLNAEVDDDLVVVIKVNIRTCACNYYDNEDLEEAIELIIEEKRKGKKMARIINLFAWDSSPQSDRYWRNIENELLIKPDIIPEQYRKKNTYPMETRKINL